MAPRKGRTGLGGIALVLSCGTTAPPEDTGAPLPAVTSAPIAAVPSQPAGTAQPAVTVASIVDGDTIDVSIGGQEERIRLIGVDTPEVQDQQECFGPAASEFTKSISPPGTPVTLEKDVSERDRYDRLLRYVYLLDGRMLNEVLVLEGYAQVSTFPPDVKHVDRFLKAEEEAREASKGYGAHAWERRPQHNHLSRHPHLCLPLFKLQLLHQSLKRQQL